MMRTFSIGGIHPPEMKISAGKALRKVALPEKAVVMLNQHLGAPAVPIVVKGDDVKTGQLIAKAGGFVSANIHSPVTGKVVKIDDFADASGYRHPGILIHTTEDIWEEGIDLSEELVRDCDFLPQQIIDKIAAAGIVGMGGATFPAHVKLTPPSGMKAELVIVNGVECEPYLTADHQLMLQKGEAILVGLSILMKAAGVVKGIIGIESNKMDVVKHLQQLANNFAGIEIVPLRMQYPQGGEKQLIEAITGRQVPSGGLPIAVGAIVFNVASVFAVYEAVQKNKPLIERVVTVTGKTVKNPGNFVVRIGTPLSAVLDAAGGLPDDTAKLIGGGPMMGKALLNLSIPVTKGSSGLLILSQSETPRGEAQPCIRCIKCVDACPMGLEPYLFMTLTEHSEWSKLEKERIMDCIECGCCTYSCPSSRPLLDYLRIGKRQVGALIRARK
jgi:Na+-translocating ferredoxin:NAD+ oxidoreductase subunit C